MKELQLLQDIIQKYIEVEQNIPVAEYQSPEQVLQEIELGLPENGKNIEELFALLEDIVMVSPRIGSKKFFNLLFGGRIMPAVAADMLVPLLNNTMHTYKAAGIHVLIEQIMIDVMLKFVGYPDGEGTMAPGGSISNLVAMILARNEKQMNARTSGLDGRKYICYTSELGHYSVMKNANFIGIGSDNVRQIKTRYGKMDTNDLRIKIIEDKQSGMVPFFINATSGTTTIGTFDNIKEINKIARDQGLWLHVDAAFGGSVLTSSKHRHLLKGAEQSDSLTWDAHKMMGTPVSSSFILVRKKGLLKKHFSQEANYLFQTEDSYNPGTISIQCGRRNDALKTWAAWQYFGYKGFEERVNKLFELSHYAAGKIIEEPMFSLAMEPESVIVCFKIAGIPSDEICRELERNELVKIGHCMVGDESYIRLVVVNPEISKRDIDDFFEDVKQTAISIFWSMSQPSRATA